MLQILSVTRDANNRPSRGYTTLYSTTERLAIVLHRALMYTHASGVYDGIDPLFVNDIREDIQFELDAIASAPLKKESSFAHVFPEQARSLDLTIDKSFIIALSRFLIGVEGSQIPSIEDAVRIISRLPYTHANISNWYIARCKYLINIAKMKKSQSADDFVVPSASVPIIYRYGFSLVFRFYGNDCCLSDGSRIDIADAFNATIEFTSSRISVENSVDQYMQFLSCVTIAKADATVDSYFALYAASIFEHDKYMMPQNETASSVFQFKDFLYRIYTKNTIARLTNEILSYKTSYLEEHLYSYSILRKYLQTIVLVYSRLRIPLGLCTEKILQLIEKHVDNNQRMYGNELPDIIKYIRTVLSSTKSVDEVTEEQTDVYVTSEYYSPVLDVRSPLFVATEQVKAEDDESDEDDADETDDDTDNDDDSEDDDTEDNDEEPIEDDFVAPTDEDDTSDDTDEIPDDTVDDNPTEDVDDNSVTVSTNDKKGYVLTLPTSGSSLDNYLYLQEVEFIIDTLLQNPPENISTEDLSILRRLKSHWMFLLSVETIHDIVTKIVKLPIKLKQAE